MTEPTNRPLLLGLAAILVAFLAGIGVGTLLADTPDSPEPDSTPALFEDLDLTPEQQARIDSVAAATRLATDQVLESSRDELTTLATDALDAIDEVLTEEQIKTVKARIERRPAVEWKTGPGN